MNGLKRLEPVAQTKLRRETSVGDTGYDFGHNEYSQPRAERDRKRTLRRCLKRPVSEARGIEG